MPANFRRIIGTRASVSRVPGTLRAPAFGGLCATGHLNSFAIDECIGNFPAGLVEIAPRGLARDAEFFCSLFLLKPFEVDEPDQFYLIGL
jgi:hypothetical protein